jgi:hypothetical protein
MNPFLWERKSLLLFILVSLWTFLVGVGSAYLYRYEYNAGTVADAPGTWPEEIVDEEIQLADSGSTLLVFIHPRCPCSAATIRELERITARVGSRLQTFVVFWYPTRSAKDWTKSALREYAAKVPDLRCIDDFGGATTRRFGVTTSGQALMYSPDRQLLFAGGITKSRGHSGDNAGSDVVQAIVQAGGSASLVPICSDVFGCSLIDPQADSNAKP